LGSVFENKASTYEKEIRALKEELTKKPKERQPKEQGSEHVITRTDRIFKLINVDTSYRGEIIFDDQDGKEVSVFLPTKEGKFELNFILSKDRSVFSEYLYIVRENSNANIERHLADVRILLEAIKKLLIYEEDAKIKFIIATNDNLEPKRNDIIASFDKMKRIAELAAKPNISLELWDNSALREKEKELGLYLLYSQKFFTRE